MTKSAPQSEGKQYDKTLIYRSYCIQASRTCRTALYRNIEHCSISRYLDNLSVYTDLVFINSVGLRNIIKDMMLVLKDLEEWLEKQDEEAKVILNLKSERLV